MEQKIDVTKVAKLAHLKITETEAISYEKDMQRMLNYMETLSSLDTENIKPTLHISSSTDYYRKDEIKPGLEEEELFKNVPSANESLIQVPASIN